MNTKYSYQPNKLHKIQPLHDSVLVVDMNFDYRVTTAGIYIPTDDGKNSGIRPRWGLVYAVGPTQEDVKPGQWILVSHGRWTRGVSIEIDGVMKTIRRIDCNDIMLISDQPVIDDTMSDKVI
jgi:co-chaperonin GroES (HSP10)